MAMYKTQWANIHFSGHSVADLPSFLPSFLPPTLPPFLPVKVFKESYIGLSSHEMSHLRY